jgi:hypothetical protein
MRTCPNCGDYFDDGACAFCLNDGTPLTEVSPQSERWSEGMRRLEKKNSVIRRQIRRLRMRRLAFAVMTMLIATIVVLVVVANGKIYLTRTDATPTPTPTPTPSPTPTPTPSPTPTPTPGLSPTPTPERTPNLKETPTPTPILRITPTPSPTPQPTVIVRDSPTPTPPPTPTPRWISTESPTPKPKTECSEEDRNHERTAILNQYANIWGQAIKRERDKVITTKPQQIEASLRPLEYSFVFRKCNVAVVSVQYTWDLHSPAIPNVRGKKTFACGKALGTWICRELP